MVVQEARISEVQLYDFSELLLNFEANRLVLLSLDV